MASSVVICRCMGAALVNKSDILACYQQKNAATELNCVQTIHGDVRQFTKASLWADVITDRSSAAIANGIPSNFRNPSKFAANSTTMHATPPPGILLEECKPLFYPYSSSYQFSGVSHFSESPHATPPSDYFMRGSFLQEFESMLGTIGCKRSPSPPANFQLRAVLQDANRFVSSYSSEVEEPPIPDNIKMPKRKGGIQLWQFLYALLTDPDHMHPELIEWTCNRTENEFRLLEPEAIAVWWGYHKNKVNINYEKFSRSLRYYYDKGILRKIPGERYVYRFCIDPERMYKHIGISDCHPQIKPMPEDARNVLSMFHGEQNHSLSSTDSPVVAVAPELLKVPISPSNSDPLTHLLGASPPVRSYARPIERSSSFNVVYPPNPTNPSEELPHMASSASLPDMYSFESFAATQGLYNSPAVSTVHSVCDRFSTSMSGDIAQSHMDDSIEHDFDGYDYNLPTTATMSETLWFHSFADSNCFFASQTCCMT